MSFQFFSIPCFRTMARLAYVYFIAAFLIADSLQATDFKLCETAPAPVELRIDGCTNFPCLFERGKKVVAQWDFNALDDTDTLKPRARAFVAGSTVEYPLPEKDACRGLLNGRCPIDEGELLTYGMEMEILKIFPKIPLTIEFSLIDENDQIQVCFMVDAKVV